MSSYEIPFPNRMFVGITVTCGKKAGNRILGTKQGGRRVYILGLSGSRVKVGRMQTPGSDSGPQPTMTSGVAISVCSLLIYKTRTLIVPPAGCCEN